MTSTEGCLASSYAEPETVRHPMAGLTNEGCNSKEGGKMEDKHLWMVEVRVQVRARSRKEALAAVKRDLNSKAPTLNNYVLADVELVEDARDM